VQTPLKQLLCKQIATPKQKEVQMPTLEQLKNEEYNFFAEVANDPTNPPLPVIMPKTEDPKSPDYISPKMLKNAAT